MHWLLGSLLWLMGLSMYAIILADPCGVRIDAGEPERISSENVEPYVNLVVQLDDKSD